MALSLRTRVGVSAGSLAGGLSRALGRGAGATLPGRVTLTIAPHALADLAAGRDTVMVTGTNGKTATTAFLVAALGDEQVVTNTTGANLPTGIVAALARSSAPRAVLEADELHVPAVMRAVHPRALVLLNLSRDQLDRTHEVRRAVDAVARGDREGAGRASPSWPTRPTRTSPTPHSTARRSRRRGAASYGSTAGCGGRRRGAVPAVRRAARGRRRGQRAGCWSRPARRLAGPPPTTPCVDDGCCWSPTTLTIAGRPRALARRGQSEQRRLRRRGCGRRGVAPAHAVARLTTVGDVAGRYATAPAGLAAGPARMLLAKNPAGWTVALDLSSPTPSVDARRQRARPRTARTRRGCGTCRSSARRPHRRGSSANAARRSRAAAAATPRSAPSARPETGNVADAHALAGVAPDGRAHDARDEHGVPGGSPWP